MGMMRAKHTDDFVRSLTRTRPIPSTHWSGGFDPKRNRLLAAGAQSLYRVPRAAVKVIGVRVDFFRPDHGMLPSTPPLHHFPFS
jgi:hypothetical protein